MHACYGSRTGIRTGGAGSLLAAPRDLAVTTIAGSNAPPIAQGWPGGAYPLPNNWLDWFGT